MRLDECQRRRCPWPQRYTTTLAWHLCHVRCLSYCCLYYCTILLELLITLRDSPRPICNLPIMEPLGDSPFFDYNGMTHFRPWLRMQDIRRNDPLSKDPLLAAAGSLFNREKKKFKDSSGKVGAHRHYWPKVRPGRRPRNGQSARADLRVAVWRRVRTTAEVMDGCSATQTFQQAVEHVSDAEQDSFYPDFPPRASPPLSGARSMRGRTTYTVDSTSTSRLSTPTAIGTDVGPSQIPESHFAKAQTLYECKKAYNDLPPEEQVSTLHEGQDSGAYNVN